MIIFDFDGTIADTISLAIDIVNAHSEVYKYKKVNQTTYKSLINL